MADVNDQLSVVKTVTPDMIEAYIVGEVFFTGYDGMSGSGLLPSYPQSVVEAVGLNTFCILILKNGFTVTGQSACADPSKFNAEIGKKFAREDAVRKIWPFMGYALRNHLSGENGLL